MDLSEESKMKQIVSGSKTGLFYNTNPMQKNHV